ncbi:NAD(P)-binding domain-containing protein [Lentilactobacillus hilgardii]|nr:NAD(P)-binding domain-containing protein [Lentilactobacillus hilgardii]MCV3741472.1 NAD(P)-binding domain-containing protein [Lentilactobacillus hilgardii]
MAVNQAVKSTTYELRLVGQSPLVTDYVFVAIGDYAYPYVPKIPGFAYRIHYVDIKDYNHFKSGKEQVIIGGNESAFDLAINLAKKNIVNDLFSTASAFNANDPDQRFYEIRQENTFF